MEIFQLRKDMYMEITKIISNIPSSSCSIEIYKKYYKDLLDYYDKHTSALVLIANTKIADLFTEYIKVLGVYVDRNEWNDINRDEALKVAQNLISQGLIPLRSMKGNADKCDIYGVSFLDNML